MKPLALCAMLFLTACTATANTDSRSSSVTGATSGGTPIDTAAQFRAAHPEWYACTVDEDCVTVPTVCGSNCRGDALNSKAYSDYVVEFSKTCQGASRTIGNCNGVTKSCVEGKCAIETRST